jgi:hypothetical protein
MPTDKIHFEISQSGQIIQVSQVRRVMANADSMVAALAEDLNNAQNDPTAAAVTQEPIRCFRNLGRGVSVFQRVGKQYITTYGGILVTQLPFYTQWHLTGDDEKGHFLVPFNGQQGGGVDVGGPLTMQVPADLIMHFFVEWSHPTGMDVMQPDASITSILPSILASGHTSNFYLTCFSRSRNTCVRLPLPNLYDDCHLCTGSSFGEPSFREHHNHNGIVDSVQSYFKSWSDTAWNNDLLNGPTSLRSKLYHRFVRFDAHSGNYAPEDLLLNKWPTSSSPVPLEEVYKPWMDSTKQVVPDEAPEAQEAPAEDAPEGMRRVTMVMNETGEVPMPPPGGGQ